MSASVAGIVLAFGIVALVAVISRLDTRRERRARAAMHGLTEAAVAAGLRPHTGHVQAAPQHVPTKRGTHDD
jgi:hypothetical protein